MNSKHLIFFALLLVLSFRCSPDQSIDQKQIQTDVCIYTATASGIMAAIAVRQQGKSVVIIEPSKWVGGMLGAGIKPIQDCPNFEAVGGATRKLMEYLGTGSKTPLKEDSLRVVSRTTMSPRHVRVDFLDLLEAHDIEIIYDHRVSTVMKPNDKIEEVLFDFAPVDEKGVPTPESKISSALKVQARIFIDASYEGELMARSGVSFRVGRESRFDFGEELAGVGPPTNVTPMDPFIEVGNEGSGVLPLINDELDRKEGVGDHYTQAYNFRYYTTSDPEFKADFERPEDYNPATYELVGRYVDFLKSEFPDPEQLDQRLSRIFPGWMNAGEYNYHRASLITMAPIGISHLYADGDYGTKSRIWKAHQDYLSGLKHFMSTDPRVPAAFREKTAALGLDVRHHPETGGWPHQLYVRISRRMIGNYTITAHDVYNETTISDPVALAQYGIDTYPARRVWFEEDGKTFVALEGHMFVGGAKGPTNVPYPISYRSITPKSNECTNLLVPVCFSATHLGYASARMEPVFMMVGESAGLAAVQAIDENTSVQEIDMNGYRKRLEDVGQKLKW